MQEVILVTFSPAPFPRKILHPVRVFRHHGVRPVGSFSPTPPWDHLPRELRSRLPDAGGGNESSAVFLPFQPVDAGGMPVDCAHPRGAARRRAPDYRLPGDEHLVAGPVRFHPHGSPGRAPTAQRPSGICANTILPEIMRETRPD